MNRTSSRALPYLALLAALLTPAAQALAGETLSPEKLIKNMSTALTQLNYDGRFVHVRQGHVEAMRVVHSSDERGELEYMLSLNGEAREVFRNRSLVTCIWPDSQSVIVSDSKSRKILPTINASLANSQIYELSLASPDRVAGRRTHVVNIKPRDNKRYGYRFWIDQETKMLLRSMLLDNQENAIEQVMFTEIEYPENIDPGVFETPGSKIDTFKVQKPVPVALQASEDRVTFDSLPLGYEEVSETFQPMPINDGPISHVMLSDGMASVSVYVEYVAKADQSEVAVGVSTMGALNAYTHSTDHALITVVGEVPAETVEQIAMAVRLIK